MEELRDLMYKIGFVFMEGNDAVFSYYSFLKKGQECSVIFMEDNKKEFDIKGNNILCCLINKEMYDTTKTDVIKILKKEFPHILRKEKIDKLFND